MRYYFLLAKSILSKDILYIRRYWLNSVFSVFIMIVFFIGLTYGIDNMSLEYDSNGSSFLGGYVVWIFTTSCFSTMVNNISTEANLGTLEQLYINSKFFYSTLILQAFSSFFILLVQITLLIFILSSFRIVEFEYLNNYLLAVPIFILGMPSLWGVGLFLAAIVLNYKNITSIYTALSSLFFALMSYVSGSYSSHTYIFIPFASASNSFQKIMSNESLNFLSVIEIILNSLMFLSLGLFFFKKYERKSKEKAKFAQH